MYKRQTHGPIAGWDVSRVDNFDCEWVVDPVGLAECVDNVGMFSSNFNGDVSNWDTSSATTMTGTFWNAAAFNRPLAWDTSKLTTMESTFRGTSGAFNPELPYCSDYCNGNVVENDLSCGLPSSGCSPACYKSECAKCCGCAAYYDDHTSSGNFAGGEGVVSNLPDSCLSLIHI